VVVSFAVAFMLFLMVLFRRTIRKAFEFVSYDTEWDPRGKVVAITGASSGLGAELGRQYAERGAHVVLCARRTSELEEVAASCKALISTGSPATIRTIVADVSLESDCRAFAEFAAQQFDRIDCLILNAGISMGQEFDTLVDTSILRKLMEVNYFGSVNCLFYALKYLKRSTRPKVVVISSGVGKFATPTRTGYSASKFALHGFFEAWRCEAGPKYGAEVTMICPGVVQTDINRTRLSSGDTPPSILDVESGMPVSQAARMIVQSVARGDRECLMTPEQKPGLIIKQFFPELIDWMVTQKIRKIQAQPKPSNRNNDDETTPQPKRVDH